METLGQRIQKRMRERGHDRGKGVSALADYAGIGVATASNLINDKVGDPGPRILRRVAEYLGVHPAILFRRAGYFPEYEPRFSSDAEAAAQRIDQLPGHQEALILDLINTCVDNAPFAGLPPDVYALTERTAQVPIEYRRGVLRIVTAALEAAMDDLEEKREEEG
jgi:transcriptional regulator with XRE-family HTH domain